MPKTGKATPADAQVIIQLYDLRRESELRKARNWFASFNPKSVDEILAVANAFGSQENAWFRQVLGYWDMAASLVLRGAVSPGLFSDNSGELFFIFAKFQPFLAELRARMNSPEMLGRMEKVATGSKEGRERLKALQQRMARMRERAAASGRNS